jgi:signal transduction histidine kinase
VTESRRRVWTILAWLSVFVAAVVAGMYAKVPGPARAGGRLLPRVPGPPPDLSALLWQFGVGSVVWYAVIFALPLMLFAARRIDVERIGRARVIAIVVGVVVTLILTTSVVEFFVLYRGIDPRPSLGNYMPVGLRQNVLPWVAIAGIVAAIEGRRRSSTSELERERLRAAVAEQRLIALTGQLHPHFLFNTLQGISTLIHRDPEAADEMLSKLADLLRDLLRHRDRVLVPLGDEIRYVRTYLEIAKLRFAERLAFDIDVPAELHQASVPLFILQPLVENALAHGIGARMSGGRVTLGAERQNGRLCIEVADDGAGMSTNVPSREGIGLSNTRERLRASFGGDQSLSIAPGNDGGVIARIDIPYRPYSSS